MPIQIPADASRSVQAALRELDEKIERLAAKPGGVSRDDLDILQDQLRTEQKQALLRPSHLDFRDVVRGGDAHALGYAPDPAADYGDGQHYLGSDGYWTPLLDGAITSIDPGKGRTSLAQKVVEVHGSLAVLSALSAETVRCRNLVVTGDGGRLGQQLIGVGYSSGQANVGVDTATVLTSYNAILPALSPGDTALIAGAAFLPLTTAGTKSLKLRIIGAAADVTLFSSTSVTQFLIFNFWINLTVRSATTASVVGCTYIGADGAALTSTYFVNGSFSTLTWTNEQTMQLVATGPATGTCKMIDYTVRLFRGNGVVV